ncbi:GldG family protein [Paraliomyxa miuraensis]|uniref:GldG family protein n=1 Tax=Paraliomyxa miuraensis TaxID=376150 RepID=UPI00225354E2|nr:Gldg family protein [Paraliomyxa miuraensis]MCX4245744.1 Gldg family protein [Paraliomyxa miuraensis]
MALASRHEGLIRVLALGVMVVSATYVGHQLQARVDVTEEGLSQLTPETLGLIGSITAERPVMVHAYVSDEVPAEYSEVRSRLLNILREMENSGGPGLQVRIVAPEEFSPEAEEAMEKYGILPQVLAEREGGRVEAKPTFLGLAFVSGPREEVVPFLSRGLSVEYEIARALRVVTQDGKKVVGVLRTDAPIMGNFDIQTRQQQPAWRIVEELRKQYEVRSLNPTASIPDDVDVLLVPQLPSLTQEELDKVGEYIDAGRPALLTVDPFPTFNPGLAPSQPKPNPQGGMGGMMGGSPPPPPKGDYRGLLERVGIEWADDKILYDTENPHPQFDRVPEQVVFAQGPFTGEAVDPVVSGLEEVVVLFGGELRKSASFGGTFTPLVHTSPRSGYNLFTDMVSEHPLFGLQMLPPPYTASPIDGQHHVLAARVTGGGGGTAVDEGAQPPKDRNVIVVADLDLFHDQFFQLRERGGDTDGDGLIDLRFDNVTFLLNLVDSLAGDDRFIELRKRQPKFRRLTWIEDETEGARKTLEEERTKANETAKKELEDAQKALDDAVAAIRARTDLDETTKEVMAKAAEAAENRRLEVKEGKIELEKAKTINHIETQTKRKIGEVQDRVRLLAVVLPPIPALVLAGLIFARRRRREAESIPKSRSASA